MRLLILGGVIFLVSINYSIIRIFSMKRQDPLLIEPLFMREQRIFLPLMAGDTKAKPITVPAARKSVRFYRLVSVWIIFLPIPAIAAHIFYAILSFPS